MAALPSPRALRHSFLVPLVISCLLAAACTGSDRPAIAARATVQTFYAAMQSDNVGVVNDNLAAAAAPAFRDHVVAATQAAQNDDQDRRAITLVRVDTPAISAAHATVGVVMADGEPDSVSLVREGLRWKVLTTGRLA